MTIEQQVASLTQEKIVSLLVTNTTLQTEVVTLREKLSEQEQQLSWFKKQLFGQKSEKLKYLTADPNQLYLGEIRKEIQEKELEKIEVATYERGKAKKQELEGSPDDSGLRFGPDVPVREIEVPNPKLAGLSEEDYDQISVKHTYHLAQEPASYVVLKYIRRTVKLKSSGELTTSPAPVGVLKKICADVSFLVGLLVDKFLYHLPLYRQHQRLRDAGIELSRATLTNFVQRTINLLDPIYQEQRKSVLQSKTLAMDETPIKAGHASGKMKTSYFWPMYGDMDEICFEWKDSRAHKHVEDMLAGSFEGILLTDGYPAYENYAKKEKSIIRAQCWSHARRKFVDALGAEPELGNKALEFIVKLYENEEQIRTRKLQDAKKLLYRVEHSKSVVEQFFAWLEDAFSKQALLPSSPFTKAANYALNREEELKVFLRFPDVQVDTNHAEREIRSIAMGRKNWNFCWTELGAQHVGIIQSLIRTCILLKINPRHYLLDVLQRIGGIPADQIHLLTPRLWKEKFASVRIESPLELPHVEE